MKGSQNLVQPGFDLVAIEVHANPTGSPTVGL
jgi:hypothetical protein